MTPNTLYEKLPPGDVFTHGGGGDDQDSPLIEEVDTYHGPKEHCCRWSRSVLLSAGLSASFTIIGAFLLIAVYTLVKPTDLSCARQLSPYCE